MQVNAALSVFIEQEQSKFMLVGSATKTLEIASVEEAEEEGREWIRRNRLSNSDGPALRYRVELSRNGCTLWEHDETKGDGLVEPTENTVVSCPV
jgi:hypothetical protein